RNEIKTPIDPSCHSSRFRNHFNSWRHSATLKGRHLPSWRVAVESISATPACGPGACPHGPRVGVYRRREADRVSKACWGRPSSWQASRPRGSMQGPQLSAGRRLQTCRRPSEDLTAENTQHRYHEKDYLRHKTKKRKKTPPHVFFFFLFLF